MRDSHDHPEPIRLLAMLCFTTLWVAGCGGSSDNSQGSPPTAVVATVAQPFTLDAGGVLQTKVRAGAEVVMTGGSSHKGVSNAGVPIISFAWQQLQPGSNAVDLIERTPDTVSFTAPEVTAETALTFQLTVADAAGSTASAKAVITVEPLRDTDHFLEFVRVNHAFAVTAVTSAAVAATPSAAYDATLPLTITVTKLVSFTDINGVQRSMVPVGKPVTYSSGWSTQLGSGGASCTDALNPQVQIPLPRLNLDDQLADGSGRLSDVLETPDVDLDPANPAIPPAVVYAQVDIQSAALPSGVTPSVCVTDTSTGIATIAASVIQSSDHLKAAFSPLGPYDNSASAHAYYATIDPSSSKTTLTAWLSANGFNPAVAGWAADAHAVYTNNYDLGFGRDMYAKYTACDQGAAALPLEQRIGLCDVAMVVVNYASVQAAANKLNPIVAVAMEYSATPGATPGGPRFVKFYVFAPDTRSGVLERVTSVDLDRRGQKSVPQSCVVCHGGTPLKFPSAPGVTTYAGAGNVAAGFLPWDLDSFLYTDTDPGFSQKQSDAALKAQFTRAAQEAQFKLLNAAAYLTFDDPNRFALARELLDGWYGGAGLPNAAFDGTFVPPDWQPGGDNQNPADSAMIYSDVFARNCRACHTLQVPAKLNGQYVDPRTVTQDPASPILSCSSQAAFAGPIPSGANQSHQIPMGCYWQLAHAPFLQPGLSSGAMPFARRTLDRFWVQPDGSPGAGAALQSHFAAQTPPVLIGNPGTSIAVIATPPLIVGAQTDSVSGAPADVGSVLELDSSSSSFADAISWSATACSGTPANPGQCTNNLPVVGNTSTVGWLPLTDAVTYKLSLTLDGGTGLSTSTLFYQVAEVDPSFVSPIPVLSLQLGSQLLVLPASLFQYGNGGAANNFVLLQAGNDLSIAPAACTVAPGCPGSALAAGFTLQSTGTAASVSSIAVQVTGAGSSLNEVVSESIPVNITM
jgi:mono/diheme cytochrome c family protein